MHIGEPKITALVPIGYFLVVQAQAVQQGCMQVVDVDRLFGNVVAVVVGLPDQGPWSKSSSGHPHREASAMVVPAIVVLQGALAVDGPSELASPDDDGIVEESALLEVLDQCGLGLIDVLTLLGNIRWQTPMVVPSTVVELHEAYPAFDHSSSE